MSLDINTISGPIDPTSPKYLLLLANLQGNILKSHGRNNTINLFLTFKDGKEKEVAEWMGSFSRRFVTSALRQMQESAEFKANKLSGRVFANLSFSAEGYKYLDKDLAAFVEKRNPNLSSNVRFTAGIKAAQGELNDPDPKDWEINAGQTGIHALILLADEDENRLKDVFKIVEDDLKDKGILLNEPEVVTGLGLRDEHNQPLEHFGYRDGVSQPLFFVQDVEEEKEKFGTSKWDPSASLSLVLVPDPLAPAPESFGSYFVFRKLEQDVAGFKLRERDLGKELEKFIGENDEPEFLEERSGALVVGRFENGIPIEVTGAEEAEQFRDFNNFNYHEDLEATRCPFAAHIRKTNPRGDTRRVRVPGAPEEIDEQERGRRIIRRGITFGKRELNCEGQLIPPELQEDGTLVPPVKDQVGLLFQCYQASIPDQFGFMQAAWANNPDFPADNVGIDPIIGQGDPKAVPQQWPPVYDSPENKQSFPFGGFVKMKGGEFFFTPSIPFLLTFGDDSPPVKADAAENERRALPNKTSE